MKKIVKSIANQAGISDIGFVRADKLSDFLLKPDLPFAKVKKPDILAGAKTIIVFICSYYSGKTGNISAYAMGEDYHTVMKKKAQPIMNLLCSSGFEAQFFCDDAFLNERRLAYFAGLGFIGKNGFLITPKFGSYVFIAHIITSCEIEPDSPITAECYGCGQCIRSCPSGALGLSGCDPYKCLSYITQKKTPLSDMEKELIYKSGICWGCDICQSVCPHNINIAQSSLPEFTENLIQSLNLESISGKEFKRLYSNRAFSWRGKAVIDRNLKIINNIPPQDTL